MSAVDTTPQRPSPIARVARFTIAHRRLVLLGWIGIVIATVFASSALGTRQASDFSLKGTESQRATDLLKREFPAQAGDAAQIVVRTGSGRVTDPAVRARVAPMLSRVAR